jgi:hypothetical protein
MPTYTWVTVSKSIIGVLTPSAFPGAVAAVPANGIIKRVQVRQNRILASIDGIGVNAVGPATLDQNVAYIDPFGHSRNVFESVRSIPAEYTALYDPATLQRVYAENFSAGDNELEVNQGMSYGKHTDTFPKSIAYSPGLFWGASGGLGPPVGIASYTLAVLYLTLP